jgi:hypothetical protein
MNGCFRLHLSDKEPGIAVKDTSPLAALWIGLNCRGIGKFTANVGKDNLEQAAKNSGLSFEVNPIEDINDRLRCIAVHE